jgi:hypothetical protein
MNATKVLVGAAAGSALILFLDPYRGRRRRALIRDQATRRMRGISDAFDAAALEIETRANGLAAAAESRWAHPQVSDGTLATRVRASLCRVCSHPRAIQVDVQDGRVTLRGPILSSEVTPVLQAAASTRGVLSAESDLEAHDTPDGVPDLQGDGRVTAASLGILQDRWSPRTRAFVSGGLFAAGIFAAFAAARLNED